MLAAGAVGDPPTGALFVFGDVPDAEIEAFAEGDPYVVGGPRHRPSRRPVDRGRRPIATPAAPNWLG